MARRRMFTVELIDSDRFTDLPVTAQMLYISLSMHADDEGFLSSAKRLADPYGGIKYLELLEKENFIIRFDSGVVAIVEWHLNNTIRKDRSAATIHQAERKTLAVVDGRYVKMDGNHLTTTCQPNGNQVTTTCQPNANQVTTTCQPNDNHLTTNCQPNDNHLTTNCQPFANHLATQNRIEQNRIEYNRIDQNLIEYPGGENAEPGEDEDEASVMEYEIPSCSDVQQFAEQEGLKDLDVTLFWGRNTVNHWCDRTGQPIKDWRALARSWTG